jgi:hypothetical protein
MTRSGKEKKNAENVHVCEKKKNVKGIEKEIGKEKSTGRKEKRKREVKTVQSPDQEVHGRTVVVQVAVEVIQGEVAEMQIMGGEV